MGTLRFATARLWTAVLLVGGMGLPGNASATLLDRGPDLVYDDVLNITWTRQAGDGVARNWFNSRDWANQLVFAGFDDWRLPWASVLAGDGSTTSVVDCAIATELACRDNEMGYMFYYDLGGTFGQNKTGTQTALGGQVLAGIQPFYWSGTEFLPASAWAFSFLDGDQGHVNRELFDFWAWAVRPGDVAVAPEPTSMLLIGAGMLALGWSRRRGRLGLVS
jgi:uncharacterized protein DUF1566/PEP-CTERM motif-containing protein